MDDFQRSCFLANRAGFLCLAVVKVVDSTDWGGLLAHQFAVTGLKIPRLPFVQHSSMSCSFGEGMRESATEGVNLSWSKLHSAFR